MWHRCAAFSAALCFFLTALSAQAQDVTLLSRDKSVEISGTLLGFDGEFYRIDTIYGELTVDGSGVSCDGPACPNLLDFVAETVFSGSTNIGTRLLPRVLEAFARENGWTIVPVATSDATEVVYVLKSSADKDLARFVFRNRTSDEGFADLLANEADIVMSTREIRPDERQLIQDTGLGDLTAANRSRVLALDGLVAVVHESNPVNAIAPAQLAQVLAGRIENWTELGGPDAPISVHLVDAKTGISQAIEDQVLSVARMGASPSIDRLADVDAVTDAVRRDPFGLGIVGFADASEVKVLTLDGPCGLSLAASRQTIKTEDYPLTAPVFLYFPTRRLPKTVREFLAFARSEKAQAPIRAAGFVDQAQETTGVDFQGLRFANAIRLAGQEVGLDELQRMATTLYDLKRLSTTFRFEAGSAQLDAQSRSNVLHLAEALERGEFDVKKMVFVGFSDGQGPAAANQRIAMRRAQEVRDAVIEAAETARLDEVSVSVDAFGEALPMACDDSAWGRQTNRRVEIWVN